jgi:uncharacterized protein DUF3999
MKRPSDLRLALLVALTLTAAVTAQAPASRAAVERPIVTGGAGPRRLAPDVELLSRAAPFEAVRRIGAGENEHWRAERGLGDLRLFDPSGREIPYLLVYPNTGDPEWIHGSVLRIAPAETATKRTSGFELDLGAPRPVDMIRIDGLPAPFLKRMLLEGSGDRARWTLLSAQATVFDLPQEALRQTTVPFRRGDYRFLRVTWDDTRSGRLPVPRLVTARHADTAPPSAPLTAALTFERRASEPGRSRFRIRLPRARLPIVALTLDVGGGHVFRTAVVTESRLAGVEAVPAEIGRAAIARVTRDDAIAAQLRIPIAPPRETEVDLVVDDGNNPPLDLRRVQAEFAELPWIYFEAPAAAPVTARYGNPRAQPPSYDLEAARPSIRIAAVADAKWMQPRDAEPLETTAPPLPDTGAALDTSGFRHERALPDGPAGLVALAIDAAMLAQSRGPGGRFADVRLVDDRGRQVPYLLERRDDPLSIDVQLRPSKLNGADARPEPGRTRSVYALQLPYSNLPPFTLVLETGARVFRRSVQAGLDRAPDRGRRDGGFEPLATAVWQHAEQDVPAPPLSLPIGATRETDLVVIVDEGDNAALPIAKARVLLPSYRLRFYRPARPLRILYGRDDLAVPQYDLALLAPQVMGAHAMEIAPLADGAAGPVTAKPIVSTRYFWIGLAAAVVILLGIIARLVRST